MHILHRAHLKPMRRPFCTVESELTKRSEITLETICKVIPSSGGAIVELNIYDVMFTLIGNLDNTNHVICCYNVSART